MANGNGSGGDWRNVVIGLLVPTCISLVVFIWNQADKSTIKLDLNAQEMQRTINSIGQDMAAVKQELIYINKRLDDQERRGDLLKPDRSWRSNNP